jgi:hypothetical protein
MQNHLVICGESTSGGQERGLTAWCDSYKKEVKATESAH